jgi:hypothetical protein
VLLANPSPSRLVAGEKLKKHGEKDNTNGLIGRA